MPCALEFMERDALDLAIKYTKSNFAIEDNIEANLLIELDGNSMDVIMKDCEKIYDIMESYKCGDILFADSKRQKDVLWALRRSVGEAVKFNSIYKEEDTVVPRAELPKLISGVKAIGLKYGFKSICYGHAGDGNLHVNILKEGLTDYQWDYVLKKAIREIFELCVKLGGTISGEHGIGYVQKDYMDIPFSTVNLELQKKIKSLFDPKYILNPGKVFDNK